MSLVSSFFGTQLIVVISIVLHMLITFIYFGKIPITNFCLFEIQRYTRCNEYQPYEKQQTQV